MTEQELNKMLVQKLLKAEATIKELKKQNEDMLSTVRVTTQAAVNAKGGLQVRRESMGMVTELRDACSALLQVVEAFSATTEDEKAKTVTFAKKVMFITEGGTF